MLDKFHFTIEGILAAYADIETHKAYAWRVDSIGLIKGGGAGIPKWLWDLMLLEDHSESIPGDAEMD